MDDKELVHKLVNKFYGPKGGSANAIKSGMYIAIKIAKLHEVFPELSMDELCSEFDKRVRSGEIPKFWDENK